MKRFLPIVLLAAACSAPVHRYTALDPLSGSPVPTPVVRDGKAVFTGVIPKGYATTDGRLGPPLVEFLRREVYGGESSIAVERYTEDNGAPTIEAVARNLHPDKPEPMPREIGGKMLSVYHDIRYESYARRIPNADPYSGDLGTSARPPRLDPLGKRRFPVGGDAYRLYRCRRAGAWRILAKASKEYIGREKGDPDPKRLERRERKILSTCFGRAVVGRLMEGERYGSVPKPSMSKLRMMAKDEWEHGAARHIERECVHLRKLRDGFAVIRFRAPDHAFDDQHAAWELFLGTLTLPGELSPQP